MGKYRVENHPLGICYGVKLSWWKIKLSGGKMSHGNSSSGKLSRKLRVGSCRVGNCRVGNCRNTESVVIIYLNGLIMQLGRHDPHD